MPDLFPLDPAAALAGYLYYVLACVSAFVMFGVASLFLKGARAARAHDLARRALSAAWPFSWPRRSQNEGTYRNSMTDP
jgi:hypothetical protein